jgi:tetratricopeptide (TPR) repeat protein
VAALRWPDQQKSAEPYLRRAIDLAKEAHNLEPQNRWFREQLALGLDDLGMLLWENSHSSEGETLCREAWTIRQELVKGPDPHHGSLDLLARSHMNLGNIAADKGLQAEAEKELGEAERIMENLVKNYNRVAYRKDLLDVGWRLSDVLNQADRHAEAAQVIGRMWKCCPDYPAAQNTYAWSLTTCPDTSQRDPAQALRQAAKAVAAEPANGNFLNTLGAAYYRSGKLKEARAAFDKSMQLSKGGNGSDWFFLAMICKQTGEDGAARDWFERAVAWTAQNQPRNNVLAHIQNEAELVLGIRSGKS